MNRTFWEWFFCGCTQKKPGFLHYFDWFSIVYILVGYLGTKYVSRSIVQVAQVVMLPFCGVLFAITYAWAGNITALLSSGKIKKLSLHVPGGLRHYAYATQCVILLVIVTIILWATAALGVLFGVWVKFVLFSLSAACLRECWQLILMVQYLTIARSELND